MRYRFSRGRRGRSRRRSRGGFTVPRGGIRM
jgi:hypothetical protein